MSNKLYGHISNCDTHYYLSFANDLGIMAKQEYPVDKEGKLITFNTRQEAYDYGIDFVLTMCKTCGYREPK